MIITEKIVDNYDLKNEFINNIFEHSAFLDIETSGISHIDNSIISITILVRENHINTMYQLFATSDDEEMEAVNFFVTLIKNKKFIVTYNGKSFDMTFLNSKINKYNINFDLNSMISIDLYKDIRAIKEKFELSNLKLKTIERCFGIIRNDDLSGKDIVKLYNSYKIHKKSEHVDLILGHNYEDVLYLPLIFDKILSSYDYIAKSNYLGLLKITNKDITVSNKTIKIKLSNISSYNLDYISNKSTYKLVYKKSNLTTKIDLFTSIYNDIRGNYIIYISNEELCMRSFNTMDSLNKNIIPLIINNTILYENIYSIIEKIANYAV